MPRGCGACAFAFAFGVVAVPVPVAVPVAVPFGRAEGGSFPRATRVRILRSAFSDSNFSISKLSAGRKEI